jgi:hypothetical protein
MTYEQFCVWLHGYLKVSGTKTIGEKEVQVIKDHLDLFFEKKTPEREVSTDASKCTCKLGDCPSPLCLQHGGLRQILVHNPYKSSPSFPPEQDWTYNPNRIIC